MPPSIPFGRHKDIPLPSVPTAYLEWCAENFDNRPDLVREIRAELHRRDHDPAMKRYAAKKKEAKQRVREERKVIDWENVAPPSCSANMTDADPFGNCGVCVNCLKNLAATA